MPHDVTLAFRVRHQMEKVRPFIEKRMFGGIAWMVNGHMACGIIEDRLMVRLEPAAADRLLKMPDVSPMDFTGRPMAGFLWIEATGIDTDGKLKKWVDRAVTYAQGLPPGKPKKKAAKGRMDRLKAETKEQTPTKKPGAKRKA